MTKIALVAAHLVILAVYIVGSGAWVSSGDAYYRSLDKPPWQPPDVVFGIAWPYNYLMLAVVGVLVVLNVPAASRAVWLGCFAGSVVAALAWANLFYVQQNPPASAIALTLAALLTVPMVVVAFRYNVWAGVAMLPYIAWLCIATSLAYGYAALNPGS
jgi:tryptophan-rich sensory protein